MDFRFCISLLIVAASGVMACAEIKHAPGAQGSGPSESEGAEEPGGTSSGKSSSSSSGSSSSGSSNSSSSSSTSSSGGSSSGQPGSIDVIDFRTGRTRLGARSGAGYGKWAGGIAVHDGTVYWVEGGTAPGLYASVESCVAPATCAESVQPLTRAASFAVTPSSILIADTTAIKRFPFASPGTVESVANAADEVVNLASDGTNVFWTAYGANSDSGAIRMTPPTGTTTIPIFSNGTPVAMGVAGGKIFWAGVDMAGTSGALQVINATGAQPKHFASFTQGPFQVIGGNSLYMYYAKGYPSEIHRVTLSTQKDERVATEAFGVRDFAVDSDYAYWTEPGTPPDFADGRVRRVAHDAPAVSDTVLSTAETIAESLPLPVAVAVAGKVVYVACAGTKPAAYADGKIVRVSF